MKKIIALCLTVILICPSCTSFANTETALEISAPSALLMDYATGEIIYEKNPDEKLPLASVTKIMTMLLAMEEISAGRLKYDDIIIGSAHAKSYGGSTIFLEEGEQIFVRDILKGIAVASGNDAAVAMGEHIAGSEDLFVERMNKRAAELGMVNTHFVNCNGLDADGHYSTARDIALMSRELMKHEDIFEFTTIWMDSLRNGAFTLSNTNKLVKYYEGCTGLKTGSTGKAKFCISATAKRDNLHLIAVIMAAETSKKRQADASALLNYGFSAYSNKNIVEKNHKVQTLKVPKSTDSMVNAVTDSDYSLLHKKTDSPEVKTDIEINELKAPLKKGDEVGLMNVYINGEKKHTIKLISDADAPKAGFVYVFKALLADWLS